MITVSEGTLNISKVIIAEMFGVSRSAVTQTSKKRLSIELDLVNRLYRYMTTTSSVKETFASFANTMSLDILTCLRGVMAKRNNPYVMGRPRKKVDFTALKRIIRAIVADISSSNSRIHNTTEEFPLDTPENIEYAMFNDPNFCERYYGIKPPDTSKQFNTPMKVRRTPDISEYTSNYNC